MQTHQIEFHALPGLRSGKVEVARTGNQPEIVEIRLFYMYNVIYHS